MTRKLLFWTLIASAAAFAPAAMAADLPASTPAPMPYLAPPPPVFTWTGLYVGVNAGVAFNGNLDPVFFPNAGLAGATPLSPGVTNTAGFTGGGEIGYNYQINQIVLGLEGDFDYLYRNNVNGTYPTVDVNGGGSYTLSGGNRNETFGTIRGRIGWAVDRALFYVTGGVAFGGNSAPNTITFRDNAGNVCATCTYTATGSQSSNVGGVVGGGIEYAFTPHWTGKIEYLHAFFNNRTVTYTNTAPGFGAQGFTVSGYKFDPNIVRVGLNYKF